MPYLFSEPSSEGEDPWWQVIGGIKAFNKTRRMKIFAACWKVLDEIMSAFRPRTRSTGNAPHISFVSRKPEPIRFEFKVVVDSTTGAIIHIELQRSKEEMQNAKFVDSMIKTTACTARLMQNCEPSKEEEDLLKER